VADDESSEDECPLTATPDAPPPPSDPAPRAVIDVADDSDEDENGVSEVEDVDDSDGSFTEPAPRRGRQPTKTYPRRGATNPPPLAKAQAASDGAMLMFLTKAPGTQGNGSSGARPRPPPPPTVTVHEPPRANVEQELWTEKHKPGRVEDLAIPHKKIAEVQEWFRQALDDTRRANKVSAWTCDRPRGPRCEDNRFCSDSVCVRCCLCFSSVQCWCL
jgi:hypothetical protein